MNDWKKKLTLLQEILIRGFLTILGMALIVIAVYGASLSELFLTERETDVNYLLLAIGAVCFWVGLDLGRFADLIDFIGQKLGFKKKDNGDGRQ